MYPITLIIDTCPIFRLKENYFKELVSCNNVSLKEVLSEDGMETPVCSYNVTALEEDSAPQ